MKTQSLTKEINKLEKQRDLIDDKISDLFSKKKGMLIVDIANNPYKYFKKKGLDTLIKVSRHVTENWQKTIESSQPFSRFYMDEAGILCFNSKVSLDDLLKKKAIELFKEYDLDLREILQTNYTLDCEFIDLESDHYIGLECFSIYILREDGEYYVQGVPEEIKDNKLKKPTLNNLNKVMKKNGFNKLKRAFVFYNDNCSNGLWYCETLEKDGLNQKPPCYSLLKQDELYNQNKNLLRGV